MQTMKDLYTQLLLLSSKTKNNKYEKIDGLLRLQYAKCLNEDMYDFNELRSMIQNWAEKNKNDCIISHSTIVLSLFEDVKQNNTFKLIKKINSKNDFGLFELLKDSINIVSFFDLARKDFDLKGCKEEDLIVDIHNYINYFTVSDNIKEDIVPALKFIAISCRLCMKLNRFDYLARAIMMPFLATLYKNGFTQDARNQAETFYLYLKKYDQHHLAFLIHAHLYSFQRIPHIAVINLTLSILFAFKYDDFSNEYISEISTINLRILRDSKLNKYLDTFYNNYIF